jgi:predicted transposase/invertase (TIGR01784 family)
MEINNQIPLSGREIRRKAREYAAQGKILNPMLDTVFKSIFSGDDEDSREALRSLLSDCIHRPVHSVRVRNSELLPEYFSRKTVRLDVLVTFNNGEQADLEMQMEKSGDNIKARSLFYASKLMAGQPRRGEKFRDTKRVYVIFFLNCVLFPNSEKVPRRYSLQEETEQDVLTDKMEILFYEMPKLDKQVKAYIEGKTGLENLRPEQKWCIFLKYRNEEQAGKLIEELCRQEEGIMKADQVLKKISWKENRWARAFSREMNAIEIRSRKAELKEAEERIKQGEKRIQQGEKQLQRGEERLQQAWEKLEQEKFETVRKLRESGIPEEVIAAAFSQEPENRDKLQQDQGKP